ncbi:MAG: hypothetical protein INF92_02505 [Rhodobacter sp.]|nr:hypothetical protein [Rhodobacter sp.]
MCYGNLDPRLAMRETEARLKGVSFQGETTNAPASAPAFGLVAWLRAALARLTGKDHAHG